ncbi:MAG: STT3 domain-containing protein [Candidatus Aenigmarchaeota archaeon]|nr:STT3 domain-containing protein [Candidatus Aenigmarchaeota archaeon]
MIDLNKIRNWSITLGILLFIIFLSTWVRLSTINSPTVLDYDPFWWYRYAKIILENGFKMPEWDILSFYPPGRPTEPFQGWPYTIAIFYKILNSLSGMDFTRAAIISPLITVALIPIPAFFLGKFLTGNNIAGLATAIFATLTPAFIGVSMAGYCDSDAPVVFYSFFSVLFTILAMKKRSIPFYFLAILANLMFIYNWGGGWITLILFLVFILTIIPFRVLEDVIHTKKLTLSLSGVLKEVKTLFIPLIVIILITNVVGFILWRMTMFHSLFGGLVFTGLVGQPLIVNVSVAELQPINVFSREGFLAVVSRVGLLPVILTFFGLPLLVLYKLYRRERIAFEEIFLFLWALVMFYLITRGIRFSLLFSIAAATSAGYAIGNFYNYLKGRNLVIFSTAFGLVGLLILMFISDAIQIGYASSGMLLSQNWYDMLDWLKSNAKKDAIVATWWDPGHIIAGYTGLRVHADGAHCGPTVCIPYNHNVRIQDMGRIMSTSDEKEAISILKKYMQLTPEQCQEVKQKFGDIIPKEACEPASEMYFISSNDLIGKFTWMNYFGGYRAPIKSNADFQANPGVCCASTPKTEPGQISCGEFAAQGKGVWVWCPWIFSFSEVKQDQEGNPVYVYDYAGLKIAIIQKGDNLIPIYNNRFLINHLTFFPQGSAKPQAIDLTRLNTSLERIDGLIWIDPSFRNLIYFAPSIKDSIFTRTFFFDGEGLKHFDLVYSNPEIRLYKLNFD